MLPVRLPSAKKGDSGKVLVIGGSPEIHGAPLLAGLGALATGVDLVRLFVPQKHAFVARVQHTNFLVGEFSGNVFSPSDAKNIADIAENWASAVVLGCGFLREELEAILFFLQNCSVPIVLDAGALQPEILPEIQGRKNVLLTPHSGEFQRLFGETAEQESVVNMAKKWEITVLRKGVVDVIANSKKTEEIHAGCSAMAVGGTGDALAGICGGFLAQGLTPFETGCLAALHWGKAGETLQKDWRVFSAEELITFFRKR